MIEKLLGGIAGLGLAGTIAAAVLQPVTVGPVLGATGAAMGATAFALDMRRREEETADEANRVSNAFNFLYESNKGLVSPNQLSLLTGTPLARIEAFLSALANEQNGQFIPMQTGMIVSFPHPQNTLQELTNNANAWAQSQTEQMSQENQKLRQQIALINAARVAKASQASAAPTPAPNGVVPPPSQNQKQVEPWNNLL